jgi:4'-phosphopantetheinyl transferase
VNGIEVWTVALGAIPEQLWPRVDSLLDATERERAVRFRFERHRRVYTAAQALKRLMLTAAVGDTVAPTAWAFETGVQRKPHVAGGTGPQFNLSHCDGLVACAVSHVVEIGIDVENLDRQAPLYLACTHFAGSERAWLRDLPAALRPMGFYKLWTLKEAYIKATGLGLSQPLDAFAFAFEPVCVTFADPSLGDAAAWGFEQRLIGSHHILAIAWSTPAVGLLVKIKSVQFEALLD